MKTHNFILGPVDTDSISFCKQDMSPFTKEEQEELLNEINSYMPKLIQYAHDGYFKTVAVLKAKNYILVDEKDKIKLKGSSIRDQKKEPGLKEMMDQVIKCIVEDRLPDIITVYEHYIRECLNVTDVKRWAAKKTITKAVLDCAHNPAARLNERKVYDAVKNISGLQEGDKVYLYPAILKQEEIHTLLKNGKTKVKVIKETGLKLVDDWNGDHDVDKLIERVYATMEIFSNILDMNQIINYGLIKNKILLDNLR